jgi:hypothetical protein
MKPHEIRERNQLNHILATVKNGLPKPVILTAEQECLERANARILAARSKFMTILKSRPLPPTQNELIELIYPLLRQEFNDWNKDDFATLACMSLAIQAANSLRDYTI